LTGRILVTGYGGFIGAHLCKRLVEEGYNVCGADIRDAKFSSVEYHNCDVSDFRSFKGLPKKVDCVVHLAGISFVPKAQKDFQKAYDVNVMGTYNALKYCSGAGGKKFIFASSSKVYGIPQYLPIDEKHPLKPENTYGRTKKASEDLIAAYSSESGCCYTVFRQFNIYGPGQTDDFFLPTVIKQLKAGNRVVLGEVNVKRDFLYIDDLVDAYILLLKKQQEGLDVFNIGGGKSILLKEVVESAAKEYGRKVELNVDSVKVRKEAQNIFSDNRKMMSEGWKPKVAIDEGLRRMKDG
jgi:nucleoside-diphosphate-sugar epimerase